MTQASSTFLQFLQPPALHYLFHSVYKIRLAKTVLDPELDSDALITRGVLLSLWVPHSSRVQGEGSDVTDLLYIKQVPSTIVHHEHLRICFKNFLTSLICLLQISGLSSFDNSSERFEQYPDVSSTLHDCLQPPLRRALDKGPCWVCFVNARTADVSSRRRRYHQLSAMTQRTPKI